MYVCYRWPKFGGFFLFLGYAGQMTAKGVLHSWVPSVWFIMISFWNVLLSKLLDIDFPNRLKILIQAVVMLTFSIDWRALSQTFCDVDLTGEPNSVPCSTSCFIASLDSSSWPNKCLCFSRDRKPFEHRDGFAYAYEDIYVKPWVRFGSYAIGIALGYLMYRTKCQVKMPLVSNHLTAY